MKNLKTFLFPLLACFAFSMTACPNNDKPIEETPDGYVDVLPENNDGNILQAFNWTYNQIKDNLPAIAASGFKVVQTSPVQQPKSGGPAWYSFYQPVSFSIGTNSPLGTKTELEELCSTAETYGIAIICDIVFNHTANIADGELESDGTPKVCPEVELYEPYLYQHRNDATNPTFHHNKNASGSGAITQYYAFGDLPDLNTGNSYVQERCLSLLKECIDAGVDGFRFDAAKHIETPTDPQYASDFWPNVLGAAKTYYHEQTGKDLITYGEILNDVDGGRTIDAYTRYMKVTDNSYITKINAASVSGKAEKAVEAEFTKGTAPSNIVTWVESHDTYVDSSNHVSNRKTARQFAIISSRKDAVAMYLARPSANNEVGTVGDYFFEEEVVAMGNRFHNRFIGYEEHESAHDFVYVNERYQKEGKTCGALLVSLSGVGEIDIKFSHMQDGIYYDQLTGEKVTIRNKKAHVKFDERGIMVLTMSKHELRPVVEISQRDASFAGSMNVTINVQNATYAAYKINGGEEVTFTGSVTVSLGSVIDANNMIHLDVIVNNSEFSTERHMHYRKVTLIDGYFNVVNLKANYLTDYELYYWAWGNSGGSTWLKDYTVQDGIVLIDFSHTSYTAFLLAVFPKDYTVTNIHEWDSHLIKQSGDIPTNGTFYDASNF